MNKCNEIAKKARDKGKKKINFAFLAFEVEIITKQFYNIFGLNNSKMNVSLHISHTTLLSLTKFSYSRWLASQYKHQTKCIQMFLAVCYRELKCLNNFVLIHVIGHSAWFAVYLLDAWMLRFCHKLPTCNSLIMPATSASARNIKSG